MGDRVFIVSIDVTDGKRRFELESEVVHVNNFPPSAHDFFFLGRIGLKATASKKVVAVGGGGIAGCEADASFVDCVQWIVLAFSRGKVETNLTLLDWAMNTSHNGSPFLEFVQGLDPKEAEGYKGGKKSFTLSW